MKFSSIVLTTLLSLLVASAPAPKVKIVYVTEYTTIAVTKGEQPPTLITPEPTAPAETIVDADDALVTGVQKAPVEETQAPAPATTTSILSSAPAPSQTSSSPEPTGHGQGDEFHSDGTYYDTGMGSCGWVNHDTDKIVAISAELFKEFLANANELNPNNNPICGKKIEASFGGKSTVVTVVDSCPGCARDDLDLSPAAFEDISSKEPGRIKISWKWVDDISLLQ